MKPGVYQARKKDGTVYYRSGITYQKKHISLGSFADEAAAHASYREAARVLSDAAVTLDAVLGASYGKTCPKSPDGADGETPAAFFALPFDKAVSLVNFRDNGIYFGNPIYLRKGYFSYYLSVDTELKFDVDDLFYYAGHKIQKRQGHLFVSDYGMQCSVLSRYGVRPYAVAGRDYLFANGDASDFRYANIVCVNRFHGVYSYEKQAKAYYKALIHINGNYKIGTYPTETLAAIAYNKAADLAKACGIRKNFPENYIDSCSAKEYADLYTKIKISKKYLDYLKTCAPATSD